VVWPTSGKGKTPQNRNKGSELRRKKRNKHLPDKRTATSKVPWPFSGQVAFKAVISDH